MIPPLFVTDEAGNLIYKSRSVSLPTAFRTYLQTANLARGICEADGKPLFLKPVRLDGHVYRFFLDFDRLCEIYGVGAAERAADGLFDLSALATAPKAPLPLSALMVLFCENCPESCRANLVGMHAPHGVTVAVSPNGFALAMTLVTNLLAGSVRFSFAKECGRVTVYADGKAANRREDILLSVLLREVCGKCGFGLTVTDRDENRIYALDLTPLDPAALGLKAETLAPYVRNFRAYAVLLLST